MCEVISLNKNSGYYCAKEEIEQNKHKRWDEWLDLHTIFRGGSKQGVVGILKSKKTGTEFVFKISQYINYLIHHELCVLEALSPLSDFSPHFMRVYGAVTVEVDATRKTKLPTGAPSARPF